LQTDLRLLKEKCKRKQAILVRQEEELGAREAALAAAQRDAAALGHGRDSLAAEVGSLQADNAELRAKLEESRQQLHSNEQMIRWLNQQVGLPGSSVHEAGGHYVTLLLSRVRGLNTACCHACLASYTPVYACMLQRPFSMISALQRYVCMLQLSVSCLQKLAAALPVHRCCT
jgi:hypothetical protein